MFRLALILRVLYRFRSLSEQEPFDGPAFAYISPLLSSVIEGNDSIGSKEEDEVLERIALIIDIINFHTAGCESPTCSF